MSALLALALFAQVTYYPVEYPQPYPASDIQPYVQGYLTDDPVWPDRLGLAVPAGRYSVQLLDYCAGLKAGQNVGIYSETFGANAFAGGFWIGAPNTEEYNAEVRANGGSEQLCLIAVGARMSDVPCFTIDDVCDVRAETDE